MIAVAAEHTMELPQASTLLSGLHIVWDVFGLELLVQLIPDCPRRVVPHALLEDEVLDHTFWRSITGDALALLCEDFQALSEPVSVILHCSRQDIHLHSVKFHASLDSQSAAKLWRLTAHIDFGSTYADDLAWLVLSVKSPHIDEIGVLVTKTVVQLFMVFIDCQRLEGLLVRTMR